MEVRRAFSVVKVRGNEFLNQGCGRTILGRVKSETYEELNKHAETW